MQLTKAYLANNRALLEVARRDYLAISQFPEDYLPESDNMPLCNRTMAHNCAATVVVEAGENAERETKRRKLPVPHISSYFVPGSDGPELIQTSQHHKGSGFAEVSGPATEMGTHPCRESKRAFRVRALAFFATILHKLQAAYAGNKRHRTEIPEGRSFHGHILNDETIRLDHAEKLLNHPTPTVKLYCSAVLLEGLDPMAGQQTPMHGLHFLGKIYLSLLDNPDCHPGTSAFTCPLAGCSRIRLVKRTPMRAPSERFPPTLRTEMP